jgi:hypothetical protein
MRMTILHVSETGAPIGAPAHTRRAQRCENNERSSGGACARGTIAGASARIGGVTVAVATTVVAGIPIDCARVGVAIGAAAAVCLSILQHSRVIVGTLAGGFAFFGGQQQWSRTIKSTSHKNWVRASAMDGRNTASASKVRTTRRTIT